ncbi:MAG: OmpH family outer membrane protein [Nitrospiraceae bacterium]|nr:MAG: OmpH family outer membrane protein [Nitrospiraceae bacterium]
MKKTVLAFSIVLLFALGVQAAEMKIGYMDLYKALNESARGTEAKKTLEDLIESKKNAIGKVAAEIEKIQAEIEKQASILTPESRKDKEEQREKLRREYQRMAQDSQEELKKKETDLTQEILKELAELTQKVGEEDGYSVIFEKSESGIMYIPEKFDITDKVIKRYNEMSKTEKKGDKK